jgi:hypothetical protein
MKLLLSAKVVYIWILGAPQHVKKTLYKMWGSHDCEDSYCGLPGSGVTVQFIPPPPHPISEFSFFFLILMVGVESNWVHLARRPPIGLMHLPLVIMMMENLVE